MAHTERHRLKEERLRKKNWKRWGPYLSERQWGTVREDYSADGNCWNYFPHDHARQRAYRWGEDGILGITDRQCRLCFSLAFWNGKDPILKERLFGLNGHEGNHGEDVKELYYYIDSTPTHSYMKALYKYPQKEYPYSKLLSENTKRGVKDPEFEILDTGVFDENRYWDIQAEYCKETPSSILGKFTITNQGPESSTLHFLPTLWFRNMWSWGDNCESSIKQKPHLKQVDPGKVYCTHETLGNMYFEVEKQPDGEYPDILFTENDTNTCALWNYGDPSHYFKDAFHNYVIHKKKHVINPKKEGTKCAAHYTLHLRPLQSVVIRIWLCTEDECPASPCFDYYFEEVFLQRIVDANKFYDVVITNKSATERDIARQAYAGLLWSKQFYYYIIKEWLHGDNNCSPPHNRLMGRNNDWKHLFNRDVISMPDKWEYPWYASWDLAFHMIPFSNVDIQFAKEQLLLFLREWYMHPNGQIPAYEFCFEDVNPPIHAYAVLKVYKNSGPKGCRDLQFLARCFHKLVLNFTWWVNRKDIEGRNIFSGGFLGLDNIGVFDRSKPLPTGGHLQQADATGWMAFFCVIMLEISLLLAKRDNIYDDMASKFFEHFISIVDAMNNVGGQGLWNENDGFYYDHVKNHHSQQAMKIRSMVGLVPLFSSLVISEPVMKQHPDFLKRTKWFLENRKDLASQISFLSKDGKEGESLLLSVLPKSHLIRVLKYVLDEDEFLSPYGIRSLSKFHKDHPFVLQNNGNHFSVGYEPGEGESKLFGGNSNWRGPIWLCMNYLLVENLERLDYFYEDTLQVEFPTGSGNKVRLNEVAREISKRVARLFVPDSNGRRPCHGNEHIYAKDPHFKDLILFYEYFHGETGRGCGASHQTGWTAMVVNFLRSSYKQGLLTRTSSLDEPPSPPVSPRGRSRKKTG